MSHYDRPEEIAPMKAEEEYKEFVDGNVELLVKRVEQHPDTMFYFFTRPIPCCGGTICTGAGNRSRLCMRPGLLQKGCWAMRM